MLITPTKDRIYFAEFDVMKSAQASLDAAYSNRALAADSAAEKQWWTTKADSLAGFTRDATQTDRDDLIRRTRLMREEFNRIGGLKAPEPQEGD